MTLKDLISKAWKSPTITTWVNLLINLSTVAVILPFALHEFVVEEVAAYLLLSTITGFQLIFTLGFNPTFSRYFAYAKGGLNIHQIKDLAPSKEISSTNAPDLETIRKIANSGKIIYSIIGLVTLALLATAGSAIVANTINSMPSPRAGWIAWGIVAFSLSTSCAMAFYKAYLIGTGHVAKLERWNALSGMGSILACLLALILDGELLTVIFARHAWLIIGNLIARSIALRSNDALLIGCRFELDPIVFRTTWKSAWRSALGLMGNKGISNGLAIFYSTIATAAELASFLLVFRVIQAISTLAQAPFKSQLPKIHRLYVSGNMNTFAASTARRAAYSLWTFSILATILYLGGSWGLEQIKTDVSLPSPILVSVLTLSFYCERYAITLLQIYTTTNKIVWHYFAFLYALAVSLIIYPLFNSLHILGLALTLLIARLLSSIPFGIYLLRKTLLGPVLKWHAPLFGPTMLLAASTVLFLINQ